ncbi:efflux RND transporter periplasmic adaptor subunit [Alkalihalophilus pseudofirmus]|uniref:efflux RND transporter periplasmic adaptor subunit n=1 Tax=Alkalihalophilus pseudofirmus TaxID=79885 RepID=UPI00259B61F0|nr:efflux RND transporter periplasmic adaptor subunit [Alkalihalophilus pseudofirmus]WEG18841.1 efflux RND transporter periplasmic adaptor subunit [Alkalihalophilus pseudofirmus]
MMRKKTKLIVGICALSVSLTAAIGGGLYFSTDREVNAMLDEPWVEQVANMTFYDDYSSSAFSGKVEPEKHEKIYYEAEKGKIEEIFVKEGDLIDEGTELFVYEPLDSSTLELEQLKMQLEMSYLQINQTDKKKKKIEKSLKETQDKEEKELIQEELDQISFDLRMSNLEAAQLQKQIANMEEEENSTTVVSNSQGIVQSVNEDVMNGASMEQAPGPFIQIVSTGSYLVKSQINEFLLDSIEVDQMVKITKKAGGEEEWLGKIIEIGKLPVGNDQGDPMMDYYGESNPQSSNYPFTVLIEEHDGLEIGFHVNVEPVSEDSSSEADAIRVMRDFVVFEDDAPYVWLVNEEEEATKQVVETGAEFEEDYTIEIVSGISLDDYLVYPDPSVTEGKKVTIYHDSFE